MNLDFKQIEQKILTSERLSREEAVFLYKQISLTKLGELATTVRLQKASPKNQKYVWWNRNLHLNPTNVCIVRCSFCAFAKLPKEEGAYTMTIEDASDRALRGYELGATEVHIVGGLNPKAALPYYAELLRAIRLKAPKLHIKAFTAVEIAFFASLTKLSYEQVLFELKEAGLDSMPGGGAEIFSKDIRDETCPDKIGAEAWLEIHGTAHKLGLKSNATMLAGIGESFEDRIDHILRVREQQDKSGGFQAFIPLACHYEDTDIAANVTPVSAVDLLKNIAIARLILDNVPHIKAYWIQLGQSLAQVALHYGADDIDGTVVDERITHAAGSEKKGTAADQLQNLVLGAGFIPMERDTLYNILELAK